MVVKLKLQGDLDKETREYKNNHKKKVRKAEREGKEGVHLPHCTNVPEMTYGCDCASMFTYGTCVAATSCLQGEGLRYRDKWQAKLRHLQLCLRYWRIQAV